MAKPKRRERFQTAEEKEFEQQIIDIARVTRVTKGGKRMRFRACVAIGNKKGRVGIGLAKGLDVSAAISKAVNKARKRLISIPIISDTIPHEVREKFGAAKIILKRAPRGTGIKAGGVMRVILALSGLPNAVGKMLGSTNKLNNARATMNALKRLKRVKVGTEKKEENKVEAERPTV